MSAEDILYVMSLDSKEVDIAEGETEQWKTIKERQRGKRWDRRGKDISTILFNLKRLIEFSNTRVRYYDYHRNIQLLIYKKFLNKNFDCNSKFSKSSQSYSIFEIPIQFSESKVLTYLYWNSIQIGGDSTVIVTIARLIFQS